MAWHGALCCCFVFRCVCVCVCVRVAGRAVHACAALTAVHACVCVCVVSHHCCIPQEPLLDSLEHAALYIPPARLATETAARARVLNNAAHAPLVGPAGGRAPAQALPVAVVPLAAAVGGAKGGAGAGESLDAEMAGADDDG